MQFALLIYESPKAFAARNSDDADVYVAAWRAYHKAIGAAGIFIDGNPLRAPETGTTVRLEEGKGVYRTAPSRIPRSNWGDSQSLLAHGKGF